MSGPRHIAFVNIPAYGHVAPTLEIARRLVLRGHRVSYAITGEYADAVAATGAEVVPYSSELSQHLAEVRDTDPEVVGWWPAGFLRESLTLLPALTERFTADRPDVLAVDVILGACGRLLRHDLGVPVLQTTPTFASNAHYSQLDAVLAAGGVRADHPGLAAARDLATEALLRRDLPARRWPELVGRAVEDELVFVRRAIQPAVDTFGPRHRFVGACTADEDRPLPPELDRTDLVLVAMGTMIAPPDGFYPACAAAFADAPWHTAIAFGHREPALDPSALPPSVSAHGWIPQLAALRRASVFVTHTGLGSVEQALSTGTPMVAVTRHPETAVFAARIAELGLGVTLPADELTPERLRAAVAEVRGDAAMRARLAAVRAEPVGGVAAAVEHVEALAMQEVSR